MIRRPLTALFASLVILTALPTLAEEINPDIAAAFLPALPDFVSSNDNPATPSKIDLGRKLYYDARFSKGHTVSCNSCHLLDNYGVDSLATSVGHKGLRGGRNAPTVYHAAGHLAQFWDGRSPSVEEQAKGPVLNPIEMAMDSEQAVLDTINSIPAYPALFATAFPEDKNPVNYNNFGKAIGAFERGLLTSSSWDQYLSGYKDAISDKAKKGFNTFVASGCITCHSGTYVGGNLYQKLGLVKAWPNQKDQGRFDLTKNEADRMFFKVPSLRNITETGPYFHDGSIDDLGTAVRMMAEHQTGKTLSHTEADLIVAWLKTLKGDINYNYIQMPILPASGPTTPKPDLN